MDLTRSAQSSSRQSLHSVWSEFVSLDTSLLSSNACTSMTYRNVQHSHSKQLDRQDSKLATSYSWHFSCSRLPWNHATASLFKTTCSFVDFHFVASAFLHQKICPHFHFLWRRKPETLVGMAVRHFWDGVLLQDAVVQNLFFLCCLDNAAAGT